MILNYTEYIEFKRFICEDLHDRGRALANLYGREFVRNREVANLCGRQTDESVRMMSQYIIDNLFTPEWMCQRTNENTAYSVYYFAAQIFTQLGFSADTSIGEVAESLISESLIGRVSTIS